MGHRRHDADMMADRRAAAKAAGVSPFEYSSKAMASGAGIHPALDPARGGFRYCNDPEPGVKARPVSIMLDVTGSNRDAAAKVHADLPQLLGLLTVQGWVKDERVNIQIGAVGDATCDKYPLQLSQFEPDGATIDNWLTKLVLEGGGGGSSEESYELAMWALVNQNRLQCWERGEKGDLFIIFDEAPYEDVSARQLASSKMYGRHTTNFNPDYLVEGTVMSENQLRRTLDAGLVLPQGNLSLDAIAAELRQKYDVRCIICYGTSYWDDTRIQGRWAKLFGEQNIIKLPDASDISEMIAALMGAKYGVEPVTIEKELVALGTGREAMAAISKALATVNPGAIAPRGSGNARVTRL